MKKTLGLLAGWCILLGGGAMVAQDMPSGPPKVLVIEREWTKPGKGGMIHEKSESNFVNAMTAATDGELLEDYQQDVLLFQPDLSLNTGDIVHDRYFEISRYQVKPGHRAEFEELAKMYVEGYGKISQHANWATFESYYGQDNGGVYIAVSKMASLAENDQFMGDDKKFSDAMGPEKMKKVRELTASSVESEMTNLYEFKPSMSYPDESWIKADSFWKPKAAAPAKKAAAGQ